jgi:hypothetical protein
MWLRAPLTLTFLNQAVFICSKGSIQYEGFITLDGSPHGCSIGVGYLQQMSLLARRLMLAL